MSRKFKWDVWKFDGDGSAYVIAKDECPNREDVPEFICREDGIHPECKPEMVVEEGWCKYECRGDWEDCDGEPIGGYYFKIRKKLPFYLKNKPPCDLYGKKKRGWFPVWIVRKDEWY